MCLFFAFFLTKKKHLSKNVSFKARQKFIHLVVLEYRVVYVATRHTLTERPITTTTTTTTFEKKKKKKRIWCDDAKVISSLIENDDDDDVDDGDTNKTEF